MIPPPNSGLPEVQIGILPAWGGSVRLPRVSIGLPKALEIILTGKQLAGVPAREGLAWWMIIAYPEGMLSTAEKLIQARQASAAENSRSQTIAGARAGRRRPCSQEHAFAKTRGNYPGRASRHRGRHGRARRSRKLLVYGNWNATAFIDLAKTDAARNLMSIFFLQERAKKIKLPSDLPDDSNIGKPTPVKEGRRHRRGPHGRGHRPMVRRDAACACCSKTSAPARCRKVSSRSARFSRTPTKRRVFTPGRRAGGVTTASYPSPTEVPLRDVDLVIEATVEKLDLKKKDLRRAGIADAAGEHGARHEHLERPFHRRASPPGCEHPENVVGIHFLQPRPPDAARRDRARSVRTGAAALNTALGYVKGIGKLPVIVKDAPGFLVNRILLPYMSGSPSPVHFEEGYEASNRIDRRHAGFRDADGAVAADGRGRPGRGQPRRARPHSARLPGSMPPDAGTGEAVSADDLARLARPQGRASGIYLYAPGGKKSDDVAAATKPREVARVSNPRRGRSGRTTTHLRDRMVLVMVNEAARVLEDGVVEAPEDVDFGMIMGTGWAPFRGGPLRYADTRGLRKSWRATGRTRVPAGEHFRPCQLLRSLATKAAKGHSMREPSRSTCANCTERNSPRTAA